jgi:hypothetical protein
VATNLILVDDPNVVATPTAGTKAGSLPKATNTNAVGSEVEGNIATYWGGTGNIVNRTVNTTGTAVNQSYYFGRFTSKALAAQTIPAQNWNWNVIVGEASNSANTFIWPVMYVWRPSNNTVVGYIFNASAPAGSEIGTTPAGATRNFAGSAVTCLEDDLLVVEAWMSGTPTASVFLQTWRHTANNSYISSPYTILFKPDTIFYIQQNVTPAVVPTAGTKASNLPKALHGNAPGSTTEGTLSLSIIQNPVNRQVASQASTSQQSAYFGRYSSGPLAAQTIPAQLWYWGVSIGETNANANVYNWPVLYIWRPSTNSVVGYIFDANTNYGVEWRLGADPQMQQRFAGNAVTCEDGDILVMEMWAVATQSSATSYIYDCWTTAQNATLECPYVIAFYTPPAGGALTRTEAADTISSTASSPAGATLTLTEAADTISATVSVADQVLANLASTEAPDTISADVTVAELPEITADLSVQEAPNTITSAAVKTNQLASTFTENFDAAIDTGKWTVTQVNGTVDFTGGTGNFTATPNAVGNRSAIVSVPNLDFREQRVFHKLVQPLRMVGDTNNTELAFTIEGPTTNRLDWVVYSGGSLSIVKFTNNTWASIKGDITTNIWANLATYQWLAFRVTGTNIYFETAPATASDPPLNNEWVVQHTITVASQPVTLANAKIVFQYYHNATTGTVLQPHKVDALNTATSPATTPSNADLAITNDPDTISASATVVEAAPVTATLTRTEAPDTIVATAGAPVTGNLSRVEAADTIVASASSGIGAALVLTEAPNTLTATASSPATGALAATEAGDTVTAAATSPVTGSLTRTEAQDTVASDASVLPFPVIGASLTVQEAPDQVASAAGSPAAIADFFRTEAPDTISASASSGISSTLTRTEAPDTISAAATALAGATLVRTEAPDTIAAAASSPSTANLSSTEAPDTISASAKVAVGATLAVTEAGDTLSSSVSVAVPIFTTLDLTEAPDTLSATATVVLPPVTATLSVTEQADTSFMYTVHAKKRVILIT